jgi:Tfp pilus assembly protein PilX
MKRRTVEQRASVGSGGFALVPALFLLVVLGALGLAAIRVGAGQQQAVTLGLMQARALAAASSGIEWGAYLATNGTQCASSTTLNLTEGALNGFTVIVTCSATPFTYNSTTSNNASSYVIKSTATYGTYGQPGYVKRVVTGTFISTNATG